MAYRTTMDALIGRLRGLAGGDTTISDDQYLEMLDDHALEVDALLEARAPFYRQHSCQYGNLEAGALVYTAGLEQLVEGADDDYTIDLQRGIVSTPAADLRGLRLQGTAYDLSAAAADAWELIAARYAGAIDVSDQGASARRSQLYTQALDQAQRYRAKAWHIAIEVERSDTAPAGGRAQQLLDAWGRLPL